MFLNCYCLVPSIFRIFVHQDNWCFQNVIYWPCNGIEFIPFVFQILTYSGFPFIAKHDIVKVHENNFR